MESFKKQLELKATEIVETLENLDTSDKVPELMRRRRGQDNFDQRKFFKIRGLCSIFFLSTKKNILMFKHLYSF